MVKGLDEIKSYPTDVCNICIQGKQIAVTGTRTKARLQIIHSDIYGPIPPISWDNKWYFVTFIDEFIHFMVVYPLESKSEMFDMFKMYETSSTAHFDLRISKLRCDDGDEYTSKTFIRYCEEKGIQIKYTIPYTPPNNAHAK